MLDVVICVNSSSVDCTVQCNRVCFDNSLRAIVSNCCDCDAICSDVPGWKLVVAGIILLLCLLLLARDRWAILPVGRSLGACLTACLMWLFQIVPNDCLNQPGIVDLNSETSRQTK